MKTRLFIITTIALLFNAPVFAEKIPVKIAPTEVISTHHDEIEVGDKIDFEVINDVYIDDKIFIPAHSPIYGRVDYVHNNGWAGDSAEIKLTKFVTKDINGEKVLITSPIEFIGNEETANNARTVSYFLANILFIIRGAEIYLEPDSTYKNIFITH